MPTTRIEPLLKRRLSLLDREGRRKGTDCIICGVIPPRDEKGPRYLLQGHGGRAFLRMNSNSYLGLALDGEVITAEEKAAQRFGTGPGAVRFISGTFSPHILLEKKLAAFHTREAAMLFSSAYAATMGALPPLITEHTAVISDELNHNCIINAIALARPVEKRIYRHLDMGDLERQLEATSKTCARTVIVTDGVFSMRGDYAELDRIMEIAGRWDTAFKENVMVVVDDSHGVGAFGRTGRGTEEVTSSPPVDLLVATLGKAFGVNGGYVVGSDTLISYLHEFSPFYIYSNPITPAEAAAAAAAIEIVSSDRGRELLVHLGKMTTRFRDGLSKLGLESLPGEHPVVPMMVRSSERTSAIVAQLREKGILATGLAYPVVPKGDEEIRFQISAEHTLTDIDEALGALATVS
jgi:glycine C-acetyltransferase